MTVGGYKAAVRIMRKASWVRIVVSYENVLMFKHMLHHCDEESPIAVTKNWCVSMYVGANKQAASRDATWFAATSDFSSLQFLYKTSSTAPEAAKVR